MSTKILDESSHTLFVRNISLLGVNNGHRQVEDLADFVRRTRNEKSLSLRDVEIKSGGTISKGYVGQIENRTVLGQSVTPQKLKALAKGLDVAEDEIFAVARGKSTDGDPEFEKSQIAALFYDYKDLTEEDQKELQAIWQMLKAEIKRRKLKPQKK